MKSEYAEIETKMKNALNAYEKELREIRAGRANAAVLDKVSIDYYGSQMPINQIASISVPEARMLVVQPYDASALKNIEKAIQASDIGINPQNDGKVLRLVFPPLTEERRKDIVKNIKRMAEDVKVQLRNIRRDAIEKAKVDKKNSVITEDDLKNVEKDIQAGLDDYIKKVDAIVAEKEKEVLSV